MIRNHHEIFESVRKHTGMYFQQETYAAVAAFVLGYDSACEGGLLAGFREWLVVRLGTGPNLAWSALVLHAAFPGAQSPQEEALGSANSQRLAIETLFDLLAEFDRVRSQPRGLQDIFVAFDAWSKGVKSMGVQADEGTVSTVGGSWSAGRLIGISAAEAAENNRSISLIGRLLRRQLDSSFEKELFEIYWLAQGDLQLSSAEFEQIAASLTGLPVLESHQIGTANGVYFAHKFDFYSNPRYDAGLGSAWVIFDSGGHAIGLYDRYDFNAKPWGVLSVSAEVKTRAVNALGRAAGARPYRITYGTYFELP